MTERLQQLLSELAPPPGVARVEAFVQGVVARSAKPGAIGHTVGAFNLGSPNRLGIGDFGAQSAMFSDSILRRPPIGVANVMAPGFSAPVAEMRELMNWLPRWRHSVADFQTAWDLDVADHTRAAMAAATHPGSANAATAASTPSAPSAPTGASTGVPPSGSGPATAVNPAAGPAWWQTRSEPLQFASGKLLQYNTSAMMFVGGRASGRLESVVQSITAGKNPLIWSDSTVTQPVRRSLLANVPLQTRSVQNSPLALESPNREFIPVPLENRSSNSPDPTRPPKPHLVKPEIPTASATPQRQKPPSGSSIKSEPESYMDQPPDAVEAPIRRSGFRIDPLLAAGLLPLLSEFIRSVTRSSGSSSSLLSRVFADEHAGPITGAIARIGGLIGASGSGPGSPSGPGGALRLPHLLAGSGAGPGESVANPLSGHSSFGQIASLADSAGRFPPMSSLSGNGVSRLGSLGSQMSFGNSMRSRGFGPVGGSGLATNSMANAQPGQRAGFASPSGGPNVAANPMMGQMTIVSAPIDVAADGDPSPSMAVRFDLKSLVPGGKPLDSGSFSDLQSSLPPGAQAIYPAVSPGSLGPSAVNVPLAESLVQQMHATAYSGAPSHLASASASMARSASTSLSVSPLEGSIVPKAQPFGSAPGMFDAGSTPESSALGLAGAGSATTAGPLSFLGMPVRVAPSLSGKSELVMEQQARTPVGPTSGGTIKAQSFGQLQQKLFPRFQSVNAEPDQVAWQKAAPSFGLKSGDPISLLTPDSRVKSASANEPLSPSKLSSAMLTPPAVSRQSPMVPLSANQPMARGIAARFPAATRSDQPHQPNLHGPVATAETAPRATPRSLRLPIGFPAERPEDTSHASPTPSTYGGRMPIEGGARTHIPGLSQPPSGSFHPMNTFVGAAEPQKSPAGHPTFRPTLPEGSLRVEPFPIGEHGDSRPQGLTPPTSQIHRQTAFPPGRDPNQVSQIPQLRLASVPSAAIPVGKHLDDRGSQTNQRLPHETSVQTAGVTTPGSFKELAAHSSPTFRRPAPPKPAQQPPLQTVIQRSTGMSPQPSAPTKPAKGALASATKSGEAAELDAMATEVWHVIKRRLKGEAERRGHW